MESYVVWIALVLLIIGALGTVLPVLPGLSLMAVVIILYGWWEQFQNVDSALIVVTLVFAALGILLDYLSGPYTAKRVGASKWGILGAVLGGILGVILLGPIGLIAGPFGGAFLGEVLGGQKMSQASKVGMASVIGTLAGSVIKLAFALTILVMFFLRVIK